MPTSPRKRHDYTINAQSPGSQLAAIQRPIAASALADASGAPAWTSILSGAIVGTEDHEITPAAQEFMSRDADSK